MKSFTEWSDDLADKIGKPRRPDYAGYEGSCMHCENGIYMPRLESDCQCHLHPLALVAERERCASIVSAARHGEIDTDLRSLISRIRSGSTEHEDATR